MSFVAKGFEMPKNCDACPINRHSCNIRNEKSILYNYRPYNCPLEELDNIVSKRDVEIAMINKGQYSKRYKLGETWELNLYEIKDALDSIDSTDCSKTQVSNKNAVNKDDVIAELNKIFNEINKDLNNGIYLKDHCIDEKTIDRYKNRIKRLPSI